MSKAITVFSGQIKIDNEIYYGLDFNLTDAISDLLEENKQLKQENKLLKQLKSKIIDGGDDIELEYDLGDYLCSIDCCLGQNHEICELKKKIKKLKQDYKCVKTQRDNISKNATETIEKCIDEIRELKSQLQQRDEVIKEAIKRTSEIKELGFDRIAKIEILDILNKYKKI